MSANEKQVGGDHYKIGGEEHWDRVWRLYGRGYFVGCITKYVERYPQKNGLQDLEKARHFLDKLIELEKRGNAAFVPTWEKVNRPLPAVDDAIPADGSAPTGRGYVHQG